MRIARLLIGAIASLTVLVAVVMLANVGAGSADLRIQPAQPTPLTGTSVVAATPAVPIVGQGFTALVHPAPISHP